ncbi:molybdate ABC transporter substrate-binding protein [Paraclostridium bifermentans]|uniref:Molybdate ABC transporter substrate-binding protein n=1 Tax=Paraclostridium bifermentans TaxID=1490 RepID=A0AA44DMV5_PARBF|nr:molybdate ABC transporter substrate-binding protein [Paraclostridium bifermentans]MBN8048954.1 molybdate ABC transporter substrate-binding protein [Paraclostridium bifermentans]NME10371.1 molybdate ABC transporter substrate-binding protein [Paraclostridium bifermentans]GKZ03598.1 molybdate ABC transporter substrate-binding protein [Paraclostridium bifermentans]GKZ07136.1 molybdate ABC transporter substrate-binding protein [Paraclostridium bifermentans]GKZ08959.1 molybdate ABC transporter su
MRLSKKLLSLCLVSSLFLVGCSSNTPKKEDSSEKVTLSISAAASLKEAMEKIEKDYEKSNPNVDLVVNFGGSGSLQKQIEQGAPCDVFISAGEKQIKELDEKKLLEENTYKNLVKNDLVLIAPKNSDISSINDLTTDKVKKLGVGEPESVPAGKYASEVLTNLNLADKVKDKLVFAKDVKQVLAWTQSENTQAGFVYYSDTLGVDNIKIVETTKESTHSPIVYPVAVIKDSKVPDEAKKFEDYLFSQKGQDILVNCGYKTIKN